MVSGESPAYLFSALSFVALSSVSLVVTRALPRLDCLVVEEGLDEKSFTSAPGALLLSAEGYIAMPSLEY